MGSYSLLGGVATTRETISESYTFGAVAGTSPGDSYTMRYESTHTVCPGGSSWNWYPGGSVTME